MHGSTARMLILAVIKRFTVIQVQDWLTKPYGNVLSYHWLSIGYHPRAQPTSEHDNFNSYVTLHTDGLDTFDPDRTLASAGIFATYPGTAINASGVSTDFLSSGNGMGDQVNITRHS